MSKLIYIMCLFLVALSSSACTGSSTKTGNTPDQQRNNSREAQGELSTEVKK